MSPDERKARLKFMLEACAYLNTIKVWTDEPPRIRMADIREDLRADFERHHFGAACPEQGYAYVQDFYRWAVSVNRAAAALMVPLVSEEPAVTISAWNLLRFPLEKHWCLIGRCQHDGHARRTTFIEEFDLQNMRLLTASGRLYHMLGKPCRDESIEDALELENLRRLGGETWV